MLEAFGPKLLKPGQYVWRDVPESAGPQRVVDQPLRPAGLFLSRRHAGRRFDHLERQGRQADTPIGIFSVLDKRPMYRSKKYDNAPMPWMQRIDQYGIALHAGYNPGDPASHGCVRLPSAFAKKLYSVTDLGTPVYIGA